MGQVLHLLAASLNGRTHQVRKLDVELYRFFFENLCVEVHLQLGLEDLLSLLFQMVVVELVCLFLSGVFCNEAQRLLEVAQEEGLRDRPVCFYVFLHHTQIGAHGVAPDIYLGLEAFLPYFL